MYIAVLDLACSYFVHVLVDLHVGLSFEMNYFIFTPYIDHLILLHCK